MPPRYPSLAVGLGLSPLAPRARRHLVWVYGLRIVSVILGETFPFRVERGALQRIQRRQALPRMGR
jgi:hypothetical protein